MPRLYAIFSPPRKTAAPRRRPRRVPRLTAVFFLLSFALCLSVCTAEPSPRWHEPDAPLRVTATKERTDDRYTLVDLPADAGGKPVSALRAYRSHDYKCDAKVVFRGAETLTALVDTREVERDTPFHVYALTDGEPASAAPPDVAPFDARPLRATAYRTHGQEMPEAFPGFLLMARNRDPRNTLTADCSDFNDIMGRPVFNLARSWDRHMVALEVSSWIAAPEAGPYQFRLRNGGAAFLLVDGEPVARKDDLPGNSQWFPGETVELEPGLHRVEIYTGSKRNFAAVEFGWRRVERRDDEAPSSILLVTAGSRVQGRVELRDDPGGLFASATVEIGEPYCFDSVAPPIFYPATLKASIANWGGGTVAGQWRDDDRGIMLGDQPRQQTLLASTGRVVRVTLEARRDDGRVAVANTQTRVTGVALKALPVESWLEGAPAFAFPGDEIRPEIHLRVGSNERMPFDVEAMLETASGPVVIRERVQTERTWTRLILAPAKVGQIQSIGWSVYHAGEIINRGAWRFTEADAIGAAYCPNPCSSTSRGRPAHILTRPAAPACPNPAALHLIGDRLTRGGDGVTLVARRASWQGPPLATPSNGPLVFLDGADTRPGWLALDALGDAEGAALLRPFAGVASLPPKSRVALIPPRPDIREPWQHDLHCRWLSALCGLLRGAGHDVVLVAAADRRHAEIAFRTADAWGIPLADAWSDFLATPPQKPAARIEELVRQAFGERGAK